MNTPQLILLCATFEGSALLSWYLLRCTKPGMYLLFHYRGNILLMALMLFLTFFVGGQIWIARSIGVLK